MATLFALGLSPYLLVALRAEAPGTRERMAYIAAVDFWDLAFAYGWADYAGEWGRYGYDLWGSFGGAGLAIGLVGSVHLWRRDRGLAVGLLAMFAANAVFFTAYRAADKQLMFAPTYLLWSLWLGLGLHALGRWVAATAGPGSRWPALLRAGVLLGAMAMIGINYRYVDLSDDWRVRTAAERSLAGLEDRAVLLAGSWVDYHPVKYLQEVEGRRPDVTVVDVQAATPARLAAMVGAWIDDRPVYLIGSQRVDLAAFRHDWQAACACNRLRRRD